MNTFPNERKLVAILAADVFGYSRLMSEREEATLESLHACQEIFREKIHAHDGRVFGGAGDSIVAEFQSSVKAVHCAIAIQESLKTRNDTVFDEEIMLFRIGIHLGDVIVDHNNLMGETVNVAARLESLADPGGICISADVCHQIKNKLELPFESLGKQRLKNIPEPVEVYRLVMETSGVGAAQRKRNIVKMRKWGTVTGIIALLAILIYFGWPIPGINPDASPMDPVSAKIPSIVVLPFTNMSGDPKQEYFVDGITEDIITDLSALSELVVLARNTSFRYKGEQVQPQDVGRELGVQYVLDGSVRKSGDRLRITAQLVDVTNGSNLWAERYDRKLVEVFALQDEVTQKIVSALAINLKPDEKQQLARSPTNNLEAYELFLIGQQHFRQRSRSSYDLAREAYLHAIELDPTYSRPYGGLAVVLTHSIRSGWENSPGAARKQALILAKKAVKLNQFSPQAYWALGYVYVNQKRFKEASAATEKAIALSPSYADGYGLLAYINNFQGHADQALNYIRKAMALNPHYTFDYPWNLGFAYYTLGRYAEAVDALKKALERNENALYPRLYLAASYVRLGQIEDAEWEVGQAVIIRPETTVSHLSKAFPYENKDLLSNILEDLRKAGLPE